MKKLLQFALGTSLLVQYALAQPTITASGVNPVVGDVIINTSGSYLSPGSGGANQTWNFSAITGSASTVTVVNASSTTYSASFTSSNIATTSNGTTFEYFNTSASAYQSYGSANTSFFNSYSDPEDKLRFPFTYNNSYTDAFSSTYVNGGTTIYRTGSSTVDADGYGTLATPAGTFSNTLRIHYTMAYHDSSNTGGNPSVTKYQRDQYLWYLDGNRAALATISSFTITPPTGSPVTNQSASYLGNPTTSIFHPENTPAWSAFPNPASNAASVSLSGNVTGNTTITLYNPLGTQVKTVPIAGSDQYFSVADLPEGIYFVRLSVDGKLSEPKKFIVVR